MYYGGIIPNDTIENLFEVLVLDKNGLTVISGKFTKEGLDLLKSNNLIIWKKL